MTLFKTALGVFIVMLIPVCFLGGIVAMFFRPIPKPSTVEVAFHQWCVARGGFPITRNLDGYRWDTDGWSCR